MATEARERATDDEVEDPREIGEPVADNDSVSELFQIALPNGLVPNLHQGTDRFLDLITWNIKFFDLKSAERVRLIGRIINEMAGDIFVFQEIAADAMLPVARFLNDIGAGAYEVEQGTTGGSQRVTIMYDSEWVRPSMNKAELFPGLRLDQNDPSSKSVFPRLPLHLEFTAKASDDEGRRFEFDLIGLHLKSQMGPNRSMAQREAAARKLVDWMDAPSRRGEDIIMIGDWNAAPDKPEWALLREFEAAGKLRFDSFNRDPLTGEIEGSHLTRNGKSSRLDLVVISEAAVPAGVDDHARVIRWEEVLKSKTTLAKVIDQVSDHLPVVSRFYFEPKTESDVEA